MWTEQYAAHLESLEGRLNDYDAKESNSLLPLSYIEYILSYGAQKSSLYSIFLFKVKSKQGIYILIYRE